MYRVYISGKMSSLPDYNYPAFMAAATKLRHVGYVVVNPAELAGKPDQEWRTYMNQDIRWITDCDAIAMIPGWETSIGARLELTIALGLQMDVICAHTLVSLNIECETLFTVTKPTC